MKRLPLLAGIQGTRDDMRRNERLGEGCGLSVGRAVRAVVRLVRQREDCAVDGDEEGRGALGRQADGLGSVGFWAGSEAVAAENEYRGQLTTRGATAEPTRTDRTLTTEATSRA